MEIPSKSHSPPPLVPSSRCPGQLFSLSQSDRDPSLDRHIQDNDEEMIDYQLLDSPESGGHPPISILPNLENGSSFNSGLFDVRHGSGSGDNSSEAFSFGGSEPSAVCDSNRARVRPEIFHNRFTFQFGPIRTSRPKRSIVHEHFNYREEENRYYCKHCPLNYTKTRDCSTGALQLHLRKKHAQLIFGGDTGIHPNRPSLSSSPYLSHSQDQTGNLNTEAQPPQVSELHRKSLVNSEIVVVKAELEERNLDLEEANSFPKIIATSSLQNQWNSEDSDQSWRDASSCNTDKRPIPNSNIISNRMTMPATETENSQHCSAGLRSASSNPNEYGLLSGSLGVIGGGQMAKAILLPLFELKVIDPSKVIVSGTSLERLNLWEKLGCRTITDNYKVIEDSDTILWSVKPQMFPKVLDKIKDQVGAQIPDGFYHKLHLSVLAGISLQQFHEILVRSLFWAEVKQGDLDQLPAFSPSANSSAAPAVRIARIMPNIGLRVKAGCAAYCLGMRATAQDEQVIKTLFSQTGVCFRIDEAQAHAHGVMIGCAVGFMFPLMEALSDGGVRVGIPREASLKLAAQAMKGAAELFLNDGVHPAILKDSVCSPTGTTIAGIAEMERNGVRHALISAVEASTKRSEELGKIAAGK